MNKLLEELRTLPAFNSFEKAVRENLTEDNVYVQDCMPENGWDVEETEDGCRQVYYNYDHDNAVDEGIVRLLEDEEMFEEFVLNYIDRETMELIRMLITEIMK